MEMKLNAAIAAMYPTSRILYNGVSYAMKSISFIDESLEIVRYSSGVEIQDVELTVGAADCKLLLTPLSGISDVDAIELCKISDKNTEYTVRGKRVEITEYIVFRRDKTTVGCERHYKDAYMGFDALPSFRDGFTVEQIDYLRLKGYDVGYMDIPSLITSGYAELK